MKRSSSHELLPPPTNCVRIRTREPNKAFDVPRARLDSLPFAAGIKNFNATLDGEDDADEVYLLVPHAPLTAVGLGARARGARRRRLNSLTIQLTWSAKNILRLVR